MKHSKKAWIIGKTTYITDIFFKNTQYSKENAQIRPFLALALPIFLRDFFETRGKKYLFFMPKIC